MNVEVAQTSDYVAKRNAGLFQLIIASTTVTWSNTPELLGRLLLSTGTENYTGFSSSDFDTLFNAGQFSAAENVAFDTGSRGHVIPLLWHGTEGG